jgi:hypothetical protein
MHRLQGSKNPNLEIPDAAVLKVTYALIEKVISSRVIIVSIIGKICPREYVRYGPERPYFYDLKLFNLPFQFYQSSKFSGVVCWISAFSSTAK